MVVHIGEWSAFLVAVFPLHSHWLLGRNDFSQVKLWPKSGGRGFIVPFAANTRCLGFNDSLTILL